MSENFNITDVPYQPQEQLARACSDVLEVILRKSYDEENSLATPLAAVPVTCTKETPAKPPNLVRRSLIPVKRGSSKPLPCVNPSGDQNDCAFVSVHVKKLSDEANLVQSCNDFNCNKENNTHLRRNSGNLKKTPLNVNTSSDTALENNLIPVNGLKNKTKPGNEDLGNPQSMEVEVANVKTPLQAHLQNIPKDVSKDDLNAHVSKHDLKVGDVTHEVPVSQGATTVTFANSKSDLLISPGLVAENFHSENCKFAPKNVKLDLSMNDNSLIIDSNIALNIKPSEGPVTNERLRTNANPDIPIHDSKLDSASQNNFEIGENCNVVSTEDLQIITGSSVEHLQSNNLIVPLVVENICIKPTEVSENDLHVDNIPKPWPEEHEHGNVNLEVNTHGPKVVPLNDLQVKIEPSVENFQSSNPNVSSGVENIYIEATEVPENDLHVDNISKPRPEEQEHGNVNSDVIIHGSKVVPITDLQSKLEPSVENLHSGNLNVPNGVDDIKPTEDTENDLHVDNTPKPWPEEHEHGNANSEVLKHSPKVVPINDLQIEIEPSVENLQSSNLIVPNRVENIYIKPTENPENDPHVNNTPKPWSEEPLHGNINSEVHKHGPELVPTNNHVKIGPVVDNLPSINGVETIYITSTEVSENDLLVDDIQKPFSEEHLHGGVISEVSVVSDLPNKINSSIKDDSSNSKEVNANAVEEVKPNETPTNDLHMNMPKGSVVVEVHVNVTREGFNVVASDDLNSANDSVRRDSLNMITCDVPDPFTQLRIISDTNIAQVDTNEAVPRIDVYLPSKSLTEVKSGIKNDFQISKSFILHFCRNLNDDGVEGKIKLEDNAEPEPPNDDNDYYYDVDGGYKNNSEVYYDVIEDLRGEEHHQNHGQIAERQENRPFNISRSYFNARPYRHAVDLVNQHVQNLPAAVVENMERQNELIDLIPSRTGLIAHIPENFRTLLNYINGQGDNQIIDNLGQYIFNGVIQTQDNVAVRVEFSPLTKLLAFLLAINTAFLFKLTLCDYLF